MTRAIAMQSTVSKIDEGGMMNGVLLYCTIHEKAFNQRMYEWIPLPRATVEEICTQFGELFSLEVREWECPTCSLLAQALFEHQWATREIVG
jgi:hypothetical protein